MPDQAAATSMDTPRNRHDKLIFQLKNDRQSWESQWQDLADYFRPNRERFWVQSDDRGTRKNQKIIDNTGVLALRTLRSGMMAGLTSPARPWFRLSTADRELANFGPVREWLDQVRTIMTANVARTNAYKAFPKIYGDNGCFGTACMFVDENLDRVFHTWDFPIGEYYIANDDYGRVRVFARRFRLTVRQVVLKFGVVPGTNKIDWSKISKHVKQLWDDNHVETWVYCWQVVEPNPDWIPDSFLSIHKRYLSSYYEDGRSGKSGSANYVNGTEDHEKYLSQKGYDEFPVLGPRWDVTEGESYGTSSPGMDSIGDNKQLQSMERKGAQALEKMIRPPMKAPTSLMRGAPSIVPGAITYVDEASGRTSFTPVHEISSFPINHLSEEKQQIRQRISMAHYEPLFLMLAQSDRRNITATEVEERHEEKLLQLGPVIEQTNWDLLDPFIDLVFMFHAQQDLLPPPPPELVGMPLKVVYESILQQAQKLAGISSIERFSSFVVQAGSVEQAVLDKIDPDKLIDVYADALSVPPSILRDQKEVEAIRGQRQEAIQKQQQIEAIQAGARSAKDLSEADVQGDNALTRMLRMSEAGRLA